MLVMKLKKASCDVEPWTLNAKSFKISLLFRFTSIGIGIIPRNYLSLEKAHLKEPFFPALG